MKYKLEIELDFEDYWVDNNSAEEVRWLEGLLEQPDNKFFIGGDMGDYVERTNLISCKRIKE